jgi:hypothetical protein
MAVAILTWILWPLSVLFVIPRNARYWVWQGYRLGGRDLLDDRPPARGPREVIMRLQKKEGTDDDDR